MEIEEIKVALKEKHSSNEKLDEILDRLEKAEDSYDFRWLAQLIIQNLDDKVWAKEVYKKAEQKAEFSSDFIDLADSIIQNLDDKVWAKELYEKAKQFSVANKINGYIKNNFASLKDKRLCLYFTDFTVGITRTGNITKDSLEYINQYSWAIDTDEDDRELFYALNDYSKGYIFPSVLEGSDFRVCLTFLDKKDEIVFEQEILEEELKDFPHVEVSNRSLEDRKNFAAFGYCYYESYGDYLYYELDFDEDGIDLDNLLLLMKNGVCNVYQFPKGKKDEIIQKLKDIYAKANEKESYDDEKFGDSYLEVLYANKYYEFFEEYDFSLSEMERNRQTDVNIYVDDFDGVEIEDREVSEYEKEED